MENLNLNIKTKTFNENNTENDVINDDYYYKVEIRKRIRENILFCYKFLILFLVLIAFISNSFIVKSTNGIIIGIIISIISLFGLTGHILKKNLIENFEDNCGTIIYCHMIICRLFFSYLIYKKEIFIDIDSFPYTFIQYFNIICFLFIQNFKREIFLSFLDRITSLIFRYYLYNTLNADKILDSIICFIYFIILSFYIHKINFDSFLRISENLQYAMKELSIGMDKISENICMLKINKQMSNNKLIMKSFQISQSYLNELNIRNSFLNNNSYDDRIETMLSQFIYVDNKDKNGIVTEDNNQNSRNSNQLYTNKNLFEDIQEFINNDIIMNRDNNLEIKDTYKQKLYKYSKLNEKDEEVIIYYDVKFTIYKQDIYLCKTTKVNSNELILLLLFKNIEHEKYHLKEQQMTTFSNSLVSSLTHELNNPLNGLNGQIFVVNDELAEMENKTNSKL